MCYWDYLEWVPIWSQLRPIYELEKFWWMGAKNLLVLKQPNTSLVNKFPCLLNLSPTNPECPAYLGTGFRSYHRSSQTGLQTIDACRKKHIVIFISDWLSSTLFQNIFLLFQSNDKRMSSRDFFFTNKI